MQNINHSTLSLYEKQIKYLEENQSKFRKSYNSIVLDCDQSKLELNNGVNLWRVR